MADNGGGGSSPLAVAIIALLSAAIGSAATFGVGYLTFASKDQELRVHLVEIALGIVRAEPKDSAARPLNWALDVIEKNSGVAFSEQERKALLGKPLLLEKSVAGPQLFEKPITGAITPEYFEQRLNEWFEQKWNDREKAKGAAEGK